EGSDEGLVHLTSNMQIREFLFHYGKDPRTVDIRFGDGALQSAMDLYYGPAGDEQEHQWYLVDGWDTDLLLKGGHATAGRKKDGISAGLFQAAPSYLHLQGKGFDFTSNWDKWGTDPDPILKTRVQIPSSAKMTGPHGTVLLNLHGLKYLNAISTLS